MLVYIFNLEPETLPRLPVVLDCERVGSARGSGHWREAQLELPCFPCGDED